MIDPENGQSYDNKALVFDKFAHALHTHSMLAYFGHGTRKYGIQPVRVFSRPYWEFEAVLSGDIAPVLLSGTNQIQPTGNSLWVFPPNMEHGWTGISHDEAEIAVFHFDRIPESSANLIRREGFIKVPITTQQKDSIRSLSKMIDRLSGEATPLATLFFDKICIELCIIALSALSPFQLSPLLDRAGYVASAAIAWYSEHMTESPSIPEAARQVNCSASHFRRLFMKARNVSPEKAFQELRMQRSREMLCRRDLSIKEIAHACGYDSQSCFSRAFRNDTGTSPSMYRLQKSSNYSSSESI